MDIDEQPVVTEKQTTAASSLFEKLLSPLAIPVRALYVNIGSAYATAGTLVAVGAVASTLLWAAHDWNLQREYMNERVYQLQLDNMETARELGIDDFDTLELRATTEGILVTVELLEGATEIRVTWNAGSGSTSDAVGSSEFPVVAGESQTVTVPFASMGTASDSGTRVWVKVTQIVGGVAQPLVGRRGRTLTLP